MTSTLKRFSITHGDSEVLLEVDTAVLTPELATEINTFWSNATDRLQAQRGDVVAAVARLFGAAAISWMHRDDCFFISETDAVHAAKCVAEVLNEQREGWPDATSLGIRIVRANADLVCFDTVSMGEV